MSWSNISKMISFKIAYIAFNSKYMYMTCLIRWHTFIAWTSLRALWPLKPVWILRAAWATSGSFKSISISSSGSLLGSVSSRVLSSCVSVWDLAYWWFQIESKVNDKIYHLLWSESQYAWSLFMVSVMIPIW